MFVHGKNTVITIDGSDLSVYANASDLGLTTDSHDVTTYGQNSHVFNGGLGGGTANISGVYDNTASTGPAAVLKPLRAAGQLVSLVRQPEGAGTGLPQDTVDVLITSYTESSPVADMVTWSVALQLSGDVDSTVQV